MDIDDQTHNLGKYSATNSTFKKEKRTNDVSNDIIKYRHIKHTDYKYICKIINAAWDFDDYTKNKFILNILLRHYIYTYLSIQNYTLIAEKNGIPCGFTFGRVNSKFNPSRTIKYRLLSRILAVFLYMFPVGRKYLLNKKIIDRTDNRLLSHRKFDGELVLFAVSDECRGKGIGSRLLKNFTMYSCKNGAHHMYLFTDDYCNVDFYRKKHYKEINEKAIYLKEANPRPEEFYLFGFDV